MTSIIPAPDDKSPAPKSEAKISVIKDATDMPGCFAVTYACFAVQVPDAIIHALNPGVETPEGYQRAVDRNVAKFKSSTDVDKFGRPTTTHLKATALDPDGKERIVGYAIWVQMSSVEGYGDMPTTDWVKVMKLDEKYPDDIVEQEYVAKLFTSLNRQRHELCEKQKTAEPPSIFALDLCVVHPEYQRRGIASRLVQWGLDEADRRGGMVSCMEASTMGRLAYEKLGFTREGPEMSYGVDGAKFAQRGMPSNIFMRTGLDGSSK